MKNNRYHNTNRASVCYADMLVRAIDITISCGGHVTEQRLLFDDLTVREMKRDGFCGPVFLKDASDREHECELTAFPKDEHAGKAINGLVFTIDIPSGCRIHDASVVKYTTKKSLPATCGHVNG